MFHYDSGAYVAARGFDGGVDLQMLFPGHERPLNIQLALGIFGTNLQTQGATEGVSWTYAPDFRDMPSPAPGEEWVFDVTQKRGSAPNATEQSTYTWSAPEAPLTIGGCPFEYLTLEVTTALLGAPHITRHAYLTDYGFVLMMEQTYQDAPNFWGNPVAVEVLE